MKKNKIAQALDDIDNLEYVKTLIDTVTSCQQRLIKIPEKKLTVAQRIWLLAYDGYQSKIGTISMEERIKNLALLNEAISMTE